VIKLRSKRLGEKKMIEVNFYDGGLLLGTWDMPVAPVVGMVFEEMTILSVAIASDGSDYDVEIEF
jgi:hypothetical protein